MKIASKREFYDLWGAGVLGFKLRTWTSVGALLEEANAPALVGVREIGSAGGGKLEVLPLADVPAAATRWDAEGRRYMLCEAAPDEHGTLQGEICRTVFGWAGTMGVSQGMRMREAIAAGLLVPRSPAVTRFLVRHYMSPASLDDLDAILDLYPDATVEFTCYGEINFDRGRNTIFWEVRDY